MRTSDSPRDAAFFDFCEQTKGLETLPLPAQVSALKHHLYVALERGRDFLARARNLEDDIDRMRAEHQAVAREHQSFASRCNDELTNARLLCHCLLQTIEAAVRGESTVTSVFEDARIASA